MKPGIVRQRRHYPHPRPLVWSALTTPDLLARWLMPNDFEPRIGHAFTFETEPGPGFDGIIRCEVLELNEPTRMSWSWRGGPLDTKVTFELFEEHDGRTTRLEMTHTGFRGLKARIVGRILAIGNHTLYGKRLPELLRELAAGQDPRSEGGVACMNKEQGILVRLLALFERKRR